MTSPTDRPLRILRVVHTLRREAGGPSESVLRSTAALRALGHTVEIATADPAGTPAPAGDLPFHPLGGHGHAAVGRWLRANRTRFDAVLVQGLWQAGAAVRRALRGTGTPYLVFPHGMLDPWIARAYPRKHLKKQLYWWWREGRVLRDAAAVCFTTEEECRLARGTFRPYQVRERVVAYGTAAAPANRAELAENFTAAFPALRDRPFLLFLSRLHDKKGLSELIAGYARFRRDRPDAPALAIAGPVSDPGYLRGLERHADAAGLPQRNQRGSAPTGPADAPLVWLPMLGEDLKWGALQACAAFILPSHQENFGIAVAEALACGRPVLISDKVNIWREIDAAGAGLVAPDTIGGVIDLLDRWATLDASARAAMSAAATACFARNFEIGNAARSLVAVIRECVAAAG